MTKREHDAATKHNHGAPYGNRTAYRAARGRAAGTDRLAERAAYMAWRNTAYGILLDGFLPTLGLGSKYRVLALYRAAAGQPLL